jgi:undecaprenyl-diphosphatase
MSVIKNGAAFSARPEGEGIAFGRLNPAEDRSSVAARKTSARNTSARKTSARKTSEGARTEAPLFRAPRDSIAERLAERFGALHPAPAGAIALMIGYVALLVATVAAGVLLIEVVLTGPVLNWDIDVIDWLAENRSATGTDVSWVGSHLAETETVLAIVAVVALVLCLHRRFVATVFFASAIAVEAATYLGTTLVIDRPRPPVVRFENLDSGASYPSGHVAASVVIYVGIAMLVLAYVRNRSARVTVVVIAVVAPVSVALARMYRGMHHPIDVISGALIGLGCLFVGLLVARVFNTVSQGSRREEGSP